MAGFLALSQSSTATRCPNKLPQIFSVRHPFPYYIADNDLSWLVVIKEKSASFLLGERLNSLSFFCPKPIYWLLQLTLLVWGCCCAFWRSWLRIVVPPVAGAKTGPRNDAWTLVSFQGVFTVLECRKRASNVGFMLSWFVPLGFGKHLLFKDELFLRFDQY